DAVEQRLHVGERGNRHAALAHLALGARVVAVVSHQRREIERDRQAGLAALEEELVACVGVLGCPEAGELAHGPEAPAVHRGMDAARVRVFPRQLACTATVEHGVHRRQFTSRNGGEVGLVAGGLPGSHRLPLGQAASQLGEFLLLRCDPRYQLLTIGERSHTRAPSLIAATTSAATSYGLTRRSPAASSRAPTRKPAGPSFQSQRCTARSTTARVRSASRSLRRRASVPSSAIASQCRSRVSMIASIPSSRAATAWSTGGRHPFSSARAASRAARSAPWW